MKSLRCQPSLACVFGSLLAACPASEDGPADTGSIAADASGGDSSGNDAGSSTDAGDLPDAERTDLGLDVGPPDAGSSDAGNLCSLVPSGRVELPKDDALHDEPTEWWYWTGHLLADDGRRFGFEFAFFVQEDPMLGRGQMVHHAVTDEQAGLFSFDSAYAFTVPPLIENGFDLSVGAQTAVGGGGSDRLHGEVGDYVTDLRIESLKAPVLQHGDGYTDYDFGGYTYYYSRARMSVTGTVSVAGEPVGVSGTAWFDHQWGPLADAIGLGWDWFAIQLDDDREIMLFLIHQQGDNVLLGGSYTDAQCSTVEIGANEFQISASREWLSPTTGCRYPLEWQIQVKGLNLTVSPVMDEQEVDTLVIDYWEGAATVTGDATGRAYIELTGYCN